VVDLAAVLDQEAAGTRELVGLAREHPDREFLTGEVRSGQFVSVGGLGLVLVHGRGRGLVAAALELLDRVLGGVVVGLPRRVVISCHQRSCPRSILWGCQGCAGVGPRVQDARRGEIIASGDLNHKPVVPRGVGVPGKSPVPAWAGRFHRIEHL
jgi:hypothetical protein